jgi:hypothetical protein
MLVVYANYFCLLVLRSLFGIKASTMPTAVLFSIVPNRMKSR